MLWEAWQREWENPHPVFAISKQKANDGPQLAASIFLVSPGPSTQGATMYILMGFFYQVNPSGNVFQAHPKGVLHQCHGPSLTHQADNED